MLKKISLIVLIVLQNSFFLASQHKKSVFVALDLDEEIVPYGAKISDQHKKRVSFEPYDEDAFCLNCLGPCCISVCALISTQLLLFQESKAK